MNVVALIFLIFGLIEVVLGRRRLRRTCKYNYKIYIQT